MGLGALLPVRGGAGRSCSHASHFTLDTFQQQVPGCSVAGSFLQRHDLRVSRCALEITALCRCSSLLSFLVTLFRSRALRLQGCRRAAVGGLLWPRQTPRVSRPLPSLEAAW